MMLFITNSFLTCDSQNSVYGRRYVPDLVSKAENSCRSFQNQILSFNLQHLQSRNRWHNQFTSLPRANKRYDNYNFKENRKNTRLNLQYHPQPQKPKIQKLLNRIVTLEEKVEKLKS